ncbi:50S ribosomal protein L25/general stress protein Ctc [Oscillibacter sp.]|uniref:50S ribosomal protein L25/general stress protein Ctc n=1 Tax=Oscillibacter sp. TaxID=1945593 RepID=UPI00262FE223|nr:50S ribosomal protein L25/general stress protein Ctc [Oscillibacter sp.]MDD3347619.1 50S ribosomal protein L25/general stress protein Ctc [Oscillibacter sp.]
MDMITVKKRNPDEKTKKLRRAGFVPCVIFGGGLQESVSIQVEEPIARKLVRFKREGSKLQLKLDGQTIPVQIKEKELNTLNNEIVHISFQALRSDQKVNSIIHIILKNSDMIAGTLERMLLEIPYASLPADMIDTVTVDLEGMPVGTVLTVADVPEFKSEKIDLQVDDSSLILRINDKIRSAKKGAAEDAAE